MRALIAEDEFLGRKVLASFLTTLFEIDVAVNGKEAVTAFKMAHAESKPYDVIFMDIMMPELDGLEALAQIRALERAQKIQPQVKVLMTTALDDAKTVIRSFHDGEATDYLVKPLTKERLFEELLKIGIVKD
jgi:two-component system chemotaxis response regulator CheY